MNGFFCFLVSAAEDFERINHHPRWVLPTLLCAIILFFLLWLGGCWRNMSEAFTPSSLLGPALISPLIVGIVSIGSTQYLYLMNMIVGGQKGESPGFRTFFSLNIHCAVIILLGEVFNFLLIRSNILGDTDFPLPNRFPVGLDILFLVTGDPGLYATILLHCTSIFFLWYLFVLANGIAIITGSSRLRSGLIVGSLWCVAVLTAMSLAYAAGGGTTIRIRLD